MPATRPGLFRTATIWTILSCAVFYLAAVNSMLARVAGTCTMGDDSRLWGAAPSIVLYLLAAGALLLARQPRAVLLVCAPVWLAMAWQAAFAVRFTHGAIVGRTSCEILQRHGPVSDFHQEPLFALLWLTLAVIAPLATVVAYRTNAVTSRFRPSAKS